MKIILLLFINLVLYYLILPSIIKYNILLYVHIIYNLTLNIIEASMILPETMY